MTEQEIKIPSFTEALSLYLSGEKVEMKESGADNWYKMTRDCLNSSVLDLMSCEYRKKPEPKTRLMTGHELVGKVLKCEHYNTFVAIMGRQDQVMRGNEWFSIEVLNESGYTLEDGSPLTVEVD